MPFTYEFPRPALTVDCIIFGLDDRDLLKVMLIQRDLPPFVGEWALPGGFVRMEESLEAAALRELQEETGIKLNPNPTDDNLSHIYLEQLYTFGDLHRDPRDRVVTVAYYALINLQEHHINPQTDARDARWFNLNELPALAFDHQQILEAALVRLKSKVRYEPIGFELLPKKFTLSQLQSLYEVILDKPLDKRNFRKKFLSMQLLVELPETQTNVSHRAAKLYQFDRPKYLQLKNSGFNFEI